MNSKIEWINQKLEKNLPKDCPARLYEAMKYSLLSGGKRLRPLLLLLAYETFAEGGEYDAYEALGLKRNFDECENFACAIEMIHTYSLIHDDLPAMDNDDLRRGKPTNHKMFGEDVAILAGDALLNRAFELMADAVYFNHSAAVAMREVINAAGSAGMIGGQMMDISFPSAEYPPEKILEIYSKKTSALFSAALSVGAILGDASIHDNNILKKVGNLLGLAFQIKDDILDETGTTEQLGKNAKSDIKNKKTTYVSLYGIDAANEKYAEISNEINKELNKVSKDTSKLRELTEIITRRSN